MTWDRKHITKLNRSNWSLGNKHPTVKMPLKNIRVDREMADLTRWLNGLPEVFTVWCCQGEYPPKPRRCAPPWVTFLCRDEAVLRIIERAVIRADKPKDGLGVHLTIGRRKMKFLKPLKDRPSWINYPERGRRRQFRVADSTSFYMEFQSKAALRKFVDLNCRRRRTA